ncbi:RING/U-box superfamily protein [Raphanus sativus]|uniref:Brassinosteroid-responsive RING protein 1 n=1 Tax=Raphanus sativus TaxID=3726 RepID=A0A6J0K500_RAPSA|nr:brassinosteroid-responsive RING protein 1 [Raphanus sativus]KAJ4883575.1 RING/U-box superfamily protein [Raphanus sativus]
MSFFIEDSGLIVTQLLYQMAVLITLLRWIFTWILRYRSRSTSSSSSTPPISSQAIKESLAVTTFRDAGDRSPELISDTCAVCLGDLEDGDEVRELRNCSHVFHRECIDRWLDYECCGGDDSDGEEDNHRTCPLCRTPLLAANTSSCGDWPVKNEPSWAVERLLYLFGDDLLV